ncbi:MAG: TIGR00730 family Rossman fold protein [Deltaproteobacteria bacterium]|nr:TIGR00730 family Rossman fold protein [Deltaproteobacteria bacterium]
MKSIAEKIRPEGPNLEWNELEKIVRTIAKEQKESSLEILNDIFRTATKLAKESPGTLNLKIVSTVLKELRYSFKVFSPYRDIPKITIFGSARVSPKDPNYQLAKEFAEEAVRSNYMIVTGGGPGIMAAGNEGADGKSFGLNIRLPLEQTANRFVSEQSKLIHYKYFFTRKLFLVKLASAFVLFPGGMGTFDELFEILTLLQTGKTNPMPVLLLETKGFAFWKGFREFLEKQVVARDFISQSDLSLFRVAHSATEAMAHIRHFYRVFHSIRYVKDKLVIRLKLQPSPKILTQLNKKFSCLATDGVITLSAPLPEESNEPEYKDLPRLVFKFDRKDYGALRYLLDFVNDEA